MARYKKQTLQIPFVRGLSQAADKRMATLGSLDRVENAYYDKTARLAKRPGFSNVTMATVTGAAVSGTPRRLAKRGDSLIYLTSEKLYQWSANLGKLVDRGPISEAAAPTRDVIARDTQKSHSYSAHTVCNGFHIYAWVAEATTAGLVGHLQAAVFSADGALLFRASIDEASAMKPRLVTMGTTAVLMWISQAAAPHDLVYTSLDCSTTPTAWVANTVFVSNVTLDRQWDCDATSTALFFATYNGANISVVRMNTAFTVTHSITIAVAATEALTVYTDGSNVLIGWSTTAPLTQCQMRNAADLTAVLGTTTLVAAISASIVFTFSAGSTYSFLLGQLAIPAAPYGLVINFARMRTGTVGTSGTVVLTTLEFWHVMPASRLLKYNDKFYCVLKILSGAAQLQSANYLCEVFFGTATAAFPRPVAVLSTGGLALEESFALSDQKLNDLVSTATGVYKIALPEKFRFEGETILGESGTTAYEWSFVDSKTALTAELGRSLYISGGVVHQFDGETAHESGWAYTIHSGQTEIVPTAGANTWQYVFTYIWLDALGQVHESAPSLPKTSATADVPVTLRIPTLTVTNKYQPFSTPSAGRVSIRIYRTKNNDPVFRFVGDVANDPTVPYVTFTDSETDVNLADNLVLYTEGGGLPNGQMIAASRLCTWDKRVFAALEDGVRFTRQVEVDRQAAFVDDFSHTLDTRDDDDVELLDVMDDVLIIGKAERIYIQTGQGPGQNGAPPYPPARLTTSDSGMNEVRGGVLTPTGYVYPSADGIARLPRGFGAVQWIGEEARDFVDTWPNVRAAVLIAERNLVAFALQDGTDSTWLYFDYARNVWTHATWPADNKVVVSAIWWSGKLYAIGSVDHALFSEQDVGASRFADSSAHITQVIETTKLRPMEKVAGYQRGYCLRMLGEFRSACNIRLEVAIDDGAYSSNTLTWELTGTAGDRVLIEHVLEFQRASSFQFRLTDAKATGIDTATEGVIWNAWEFDVVGLPAGAPLAAADRR